MKIGSRVKIVNATQRFLNGCTATVVKSPRPQLFAGYVALHIDGTDAHVINNIAAAHLKAL